LANALESVARLVTPSSMQWNVLVVDNNSNDQTREVVEDFCRRFPGWFSLDLSPVGLQSSIVPDNFRLLYSLNPMVGIIDGFRWSLLGAQNKKNLPSLAISMVEVAAILISGVLYFRKTERTFADVVYA
jgi:glycosyltransferase involved in cell wall biosynthesis